MFQSREASAVLGNGRGRTAPRAYKASTRAGNNSRREPLGSQSGRAGHWYARRTRVAGRSETIPCQETRTTSSHFAWICFDESGSRGNGMTERRTRFPPPEETKALPMPADDRLGFDDEEGAAPALGPR